MNFVKTAMFAMVALAGGTAFAHHSITGQFDVSKELKLTGTVSKVEWINPHIIVHIDVKDAAGKVNTWQLESVPVAFARKAGLTKERLMAVNQVVTMTCYPARDGTAHLGVLFRIDYPDGTFFTMVPQQTRG